MKSQATQQGNRGYTTQVDILKAGYYGSDIELIQKIKSGESAAIDRFYRMNRVEFLHWTFKTFSLTMENALDIYHDTFIILCENVKNGKLRYLQSSLKTYMFAISKNLILNQYTKDKKIREKWDLMREE